MYAMNVYKPDLHLMIGQRSDIREFQDFLELQRRSDTQIEDWDTVVERLRRKFT